MKRLSTALMGMVVLTSMAHAATVSNSYVFIENEVDGEYFITPDKTDPRFSGANIFTRFSSDAQDSLGYMGLNANSISKNSNLDIRLTNLPHVSAPFIGNRCKRNSSGCPDTGYLPGVMKQDGVYGVKIEGIGGGQRYVRPVFSDSFYEYIKEIAVGSNTSLVLRSCYTDVNYDPSKGQACESLGGKVREDTFVVEKTGNLKLESTNSLQEIFIASDGSPEIGLGSDLCKIGVVGKETGAICNLVSYQMQGDVFSGMSTTMKTDKLGFNPAAKTILLSADGATDWVNYSAKTKSRVLFNSASNGVYVFLSKTFLKGLIDRSIDLSNTEGIFTFSFTNSSAPQSGYYEFAPSNNIVLRPRDYGISIVSKEMVARPHRQGKVGEGEPPLVFDYIVTTSGPRQADSVTAQVSGEMQKINGRAYCIFSSRDSTMKVPFSAYLSWSDIKGEVNLTRSSCDDKPVSLNSANWDEISWANPAQNDGNYYRTGLTLTFPMDENASLFALDGREWIGIVSASGEIKVSAVWK